MYLGTNSLLYEMSSMTGTSATSVSDMFRGTAPNADADNSSVQNVYKASPPILSEFDAYGKFMDNLAPSPMNITTNHKAWAWTTTGNRKFVIVEYVIRNAGASTLNNMYSGIIADWDIMNYSLNKVNQDAALKMGYTYSTEASGLYAGIKVLSSTPFVHYGIDNITGGGGGVDPTGGSPEFSTAEKYTVLSTNRATAGGAGAGNDVIDCVSSGPFSVAAGDSVKVAFALLAGDNLSDLQISAANAQIQYDNLTGIVAGNNSYGEFSLGQNYPNPVNQNSTIIEFTLAEQANVKLDLYNMLGNKVTTLVSLNLKQGKHAHACDVSKLGAGIYFYQLQANGKSITKKMLIAK